MACFFFYSGSGCKYLSWFIFLTVLSLLAVSVAILVAIAVDYLDQHGSQQSRVFGCGGDTIYLDQEKSLLHSSWTVKECLDYYEFDHTTTLHRVKVNDGVVVHEKNLTFQSGRLHTVFQSKVVGIVHNLYLLPGSWINYTICLGTNRTSPQLAARFFIFNDNVDLQNFIGTSNGTATGAVYEQRLAIGSDNHPVCTSIHFDVTKTSYYYLTTQAPSGIEYIFNYTVSQRHLNGTDYVPLCNVSTSHECDVSIPDTISNEEYALLGTIYKYPPYVAVPPMIHICVTDKKSFFVSGMTIAAGSFLIFVIVAVVFVLVCFRARAVRKRRKQTYSAVRTEIN